MRHASLAFLPLLVLLLLLPATAPVAQELRVSTENDIFTNQPTGDDLYTFSVAFEFEYHNLAVSLRENAFTDRTAGVRFDETYLSLGWNVPVAPKWKAQAEISLVHVGQGLLGERVQNAVHRAIGRDEVDLRYLESNLHPRFAMAADRLMVAGQRLTWGPRVEVDLVPGLRSWALIAVEATWRPSSGIVVELLAGGRFTEASLPELEPHLARNAAAGRVGILLGRRFFLSWSYNEYGDTREHLSAGFRLAVGGQEG